MNTDVLCSIVAETAHTKTEKVIYKFKIVFLEIRILCVYIRERTHSPERTLFAIVVIFDWRKAVGMEHPVATSNCLVEIVGDSIDIESRMVGKNVDNHFHIIFRCRIEHLLHFLARSDNSVSYLPVGRLIIVIPRAVFTLVIENFGDFPSGLKCCCTGEV